LARRIGGFGWRAVMGIPALVVLGLIVLAADFVRQGPVVDIPAEDAPPPGGGEEAMKGAHTPARRATLAREVLHLLGRPEFQTICVLSFVLTLIRQALGTWSVDFLLSIQSGKGSLGVAALQSTGFELAGAASIFGLGLAYDRLSPAARRWLIIGILALLAGVLFLLAGVSKANPAGAW